MSDMFLAILNMSFSASILIAVILLLRVALKKMPRYIVCILWALVAVRLICPFTLESALSLIPSAEPIPSDIGYMQEPMINSGVDFVDEALNPLIVESFSPKAETASVNPIQIWIAIATNIWVLGMIVMGIYTAVSYIVLRKKVNASICREGNVYICDDIDSPFILGVIRPRIYLPSFLNEEQIGHVLAHENAHLKRLDYLWKPLGFLLLTIYWFNPLMWVSYIALCKDIELACDERVVKTMGLQEKKAYTHTLVNCSVSRKSIAACPVAFGEVGVKDRVMRVLNYKKPSFWVLMISVVAVCVVAVCFVTNPKEESEVNSGVRQEQSQDNEIGNEQIEQQENAGIPEQVGDQDQPGPEENGDSGFVPEIGEGNRENPEQDGSLQEGVTMGEVMDRILAKTSLEDAKLFSYSDISTDEDQLYFLDSTEDGMHELYGFFSKEYGYSGMLINYIIDGEDNWNYLYELDSWMGYELPQFAETQDGLFLTYCHLNGSGTHIDRLFHLNSYGTGTVLYDEFTTEMISEQLAKVAEIRLDKDEEEVLIYSKEGGTEKLIDSMPFTADLKSDEVTIVDAGFDFNQIQFIAGEGIALSIGVGVYVEESALPDDVVSLLFNIKMEQGEFNLEGTRLHLLVDPMRPLREETREEEKNEIEEKLQTLIEEAEAIKMLQEQLILAYENTYGEFIPSDVEPVGTVDDSVYLAYTIPRLQVSEETDEYYVIPVIWDFRVYKETGKITKYYNGIDPLETEFDPMAEGALGFAG